MAGQVINKEKTKKAKGIMKEFCRIFDDLFVYTWYSAFSTLIVQAIWMGPLLPTMSTLRT